ncbi:hypothetical protein [Homoserinibacter sp. YIM 151385]|uniref:hypothetical protein n=1 Tax=Homoserinibacter sp. YIM 151385 TaxID=2985506 RepID=UPI0022F0CC9C|nr:hypothetical protein [Homoserinibacter sp. YIM 151385]WBU36713.1 hypothetical protein OF852_07120 [Homoserinibacter sp. YIM 151385]
MTDVEQPEGTQDTAAPNAISGGSPVSSRPSPSHRTWLMITIGAFVLGGLLGGSVAALATAGGPGDDTATSSEADAGGVTAIEQAGRRCGLVNMDGRSTASGVEVGDGGMSLTLDTKGNDDSTGIAYSDAECMFTQLKMTDAIKSRVEATRALDGRQTGDWGDFDASWGYHPDHGLDMVIEDQS